MQPMTPEQIKALFEQVQKAITIGKLVAAMTPTDLDDKALAYAETVMNTIEPFAEQPWVANLFNFCLQFFQHKDAPKLVAALQTAFETPVA